MKLRSVLAVLFVVVMTTVCVRLGFWQLSRLHEKQAMNAAMRAGLALPPLRVGDADTPPDSVRQRRVEVSGTYDERRQFLLAGRAHGGAPGVDVVTPLVLAGGKQAVLVDRGWLYSDDASTAHPERFPEPGMRTVLGVAEPLLGGRGGPALRVVRPDSLGAEVWSARWFDRDSMAARLPYSIAGFAVKQLPGEGVPEQPLRLEPRPYDESMHRGYAVQWFLFAAILSIGSVILAVSRRRNPGTLVPPGGG